MINRRRSTGVLLLLSGTLTFLSVACSSTNIVKPTSPGSKPDSNSISVSPAANQPPSHQPVAKTTTANTYQQAIDFAQSAINISQSAQSIEDWNLVIDRWKQAIALLKTIPPSSSDRAIAMTKLAEYQHYLSLTQNRLANLQLSSPDAIAAANSPKAAAFAESIAQSQLSPENQPVFVATIKRRISRTPVVDVTFNGKHTFEMILDTGASTTVITPEIAAKIGVRQDRVMIADTASDKRVKFGAGQVQSITVGGAVAENVQVAIASSSALNTGLLGQDFFSRYDVWIKQNVVEFHPR